MTEPESSIAPNRDNRRNSREPVPIESVDLTLEERSALAGLLIWGRRPTLDHLLKLSGAGMVEGVEHEALPTVTAAGKKWLFDYISAPSP